jgi:glycosyltransferase involved in cell wall biosynthesis
MNTQGNSTIKPTLLVLASTFPRWKDDTEPRFVYDLCKRLKAEFEIIVLAPHSRGSQVQEELDGLQVIRYRYAPVALENLAYEGGITAKLKSNKLNWLVLPFFFLGQWLAIIRLLKQYPVKVIHAHWLIPQGILALTARLISINKPAILCTSHGGDLYSLNDPVSKAIKRYVIRNVDELTVVSAAMQKEVQQLVPEARLPVVAPMGTDLHHLFTSDTSVSRKDNQLLFVGRLVEKKGLVYLLDALPQIINKKPDIILNIAGTGPEQTKLEQQAEKLGIKDKVNFLGRLSHQELVHQYRQATLAAFPFIQAKDGDVEGLGLVMIEAMGCGCPVVASDIPAIRDVIIDGKTGVLIKPSNIQVLADKILALLETPEQRKNIIGDARKYVLNKFSWEGSAKKYLSLLTNKI